MCAIKAGQNAWKTRSLAQKLLGTQIAGLPRAATEASRLSAVGSTAGRMLGVADGVGAILLEPLQEAWALGKSQSAAEDEALLRSNFAGQVVGDL